MKLLLTSEGITNYSIEQALRSLSDKPLKELQCAFVPTASHWIKEDKSWLITDLKKCHELFKSVDIVDIAILSKANLHKRLSQTDLIFMEGGNTFFLMHWIHKSKLVSDLKEILKDKIYVGASAGSMVATQDLFLSDSEITYGQEFIEKEEPLNLVDFCILPHYKSINNFNVNEENLEKLAKETGQTIYALDDDSAIKIVDGDIEVISEGDWKKF